MENAAYKLIETVSYAWNSKKVLDCVNHKLAKKLEFYGVKGLLLDWFGSYLEGRKQTIDLKFPKFNNYSNWPIFKYGAP